MPQFFWSQQFFKEDHNQYTLFYILRVQYVFFKQGNAIKDLINTLRKVTGPNDKEQLCVQGLSSPPPKIYYFFCLKWALPYQMSVKGDIICVLQHKCILCTFFCIRLKILPSKCTCVLWEHLLLTDGWHSMQGISFSFVTSNWENILQPSVEFQAT